mmetsp:Transcript_23283/g.65970  ORF Transcript_23283/g.65970 Transcript_23283/m.65970 type:complete len:232 (-) Transcript_23283:219-914(-)
MDKQKSYRPDDNKHDAVNFDSWDSAQLVEYLAKAGVGEYGEMFMAHKITGRLAPLLTDNDLKEMGIAIVGDRLRVKAIIHNLGRKVRFDTRMKILWEGTERVYHSSAQETCFTCCGFFPIDPSTYKLTHNHLRIKKVTPARCGPIELCCCKEYTINSIDLSKIDDVDVLGEPAPCCVRVFCCAAGRDLIELQTKTKPEDAKVVLALRQGDGERVSTIIMNQIEDAQVIERD